jgi:glycerol-1-phosphate dehydrogenase [NAD(P)+]
VGDLISNLSAVFDARLAQSKGIEKTDSMALTLAEAGPISLLQFKNKSIKSNEFLLCLAHGLIKSGFAMCTVGSSRPASGSEHKISHSIDYLYSPRKTLHGEQVGIGTIFTMSLQENEYLDKVKKLYAQIGFPQNLKHLGITEDEFIKVIYNVKNIRPERYTILEDKKLTLKEIKKVIKKIKL